MSALQNQYWKCYKYYSQYKTQFLHNDIKEWEAKNKCHIHLTVADIADIKSELKCLLLADVKMKYQKHIQISHPRNYVLAVCKNDLKNTLIKLSRLRINKSRYENEWKVKMIDAKNRKNENLLVILDKYSYEEIRELFRAVLTIREIAVVYLVHCQFSYVKIAKAMKISEDYCRKLYNKAENKLKKALGLA